MDNKILRFDLEPSQIRIKDLLNKQFLDISIDAISDVYPNRNKSHFTTDSLNTAIPTVKNKPVLGAFGKGKINGPNDFDEHNADIKYDGELGQAYWDYENGERILGTVRESDYVGVEEKNGQNWLTFRCCLWTLYNYKAVKALLKSKRKRVSVEVMVVKSYIDEKGIEVIEEFELLGVTILGDKTLEGIPGAHLTILEKLENSLFKKNVECLQFAYKALDEEDKVSNLDNSNLHNNDNKCQDFIEEGGNNKMLTAEQKRQLLEAAVARHFNDDDDQEHCCVYYVCDYSDNEVYVYVGDGKYIKYTYTINDENDVDIDFDNGVEVMRSWEEFTENNKEEKMATESNQENEKCHSTNEASEKEMANETEEKSPADSQENNTAKNEESDEKCEMSTEEEKCEMSAENNSTNYEAVNGNNEGYPVEIDGKTYSVEELKDAFVALTQQYYTAKTELDTLKEKVFKEECEKMYSASCQMFDSEEELEESDNEKIIAMKAEIKNKCDKGEFKAMEDCISYTEGVIAKYTYHKRKESKKNNAAENHREEVNTFSVDITSVNSSTKNRSPKEILSNFVNN